MNFERVFNRLLCLTCQPSDPERGLFPNDKHLMESIFWLGWLIHFNYGKSLSCQNKCSMWLMFSRPSQHHYCIDLFGHSKTLSIVSICFIFLWCRKKEILTGKNSMNVWREMDTVLDKGPCSFQWKLLRGTGSQNNLTQEQKYPDHSGS